MEWRRDVLCHRIPVAASGECAEGGGGQDGSLETKEEATEIDQARDEGGSAQREAWLCQTETISLSGPGSHPTSHSPEARIHLYGFYGH